MKDFTPRAGEAMALAKREAARLHHDSIGTEHLLLGLIALEQGIVVNVLSKMGINLSAVRREVEKQAAPGPDSGRALKPAKIPFSPRFKMTLTLAGKEAKALNNRYIGTEHLLLGLMREGKGVAARVLTHLGLDLERTRAEIIGELEPDETKKKALLVPAGEVDRIRQELAVLKSKVEMISNTVAKASQRASPRTQPESPDDVTSSLRLLSDPPPATILKTVTRVLNYAAWIVAFVLLARLVATSFRKR